MVSKPKLVELEPDEEDDCSDDAAEGLVELKFATPTRRELVARVEGIVEEAERAFGREDGDTIDGWSLSGRRQRRQTCDNAAIFF